MLALVLTTGFPLVVMAADTDSPYKIPRHVRYGYELHNRTATVVTNAGLWIYAPIERTASQRCVDLSASIPYEMETDQLGNRVLHFRIDRLAPYASRQVIVEADLLMAEESMRTDDALPAWLRAEPLMEWNAPAFQEGGPRRLPQDAAGKSRRIYSWVADSVQDEGYVEEDRGALYALDKKRGDCTEFACLFAALCRKERIPARVFSGYVCTRNRNLGPAGYHNWAEYYVDGTWRIADPQRRRFDERQSEYVAMSVLGQSTNGLQGQPRYRVTGDGIEASLMIWRKP